MNVLESSAAESNRRMPRMRFSAEASERLMAIYQSGISKPNKQLREELAQELHKTSRSIQIWFQNRRAKAKLVAAKEFNSVDNEDSENPSYDQHTSKISLSKLNMNAVECLSSPLSAKFNRSPLKSPFTGPKSAYAFNSRHEPYGYPKKVYSQSPNQYQQKGFDASRISPYPSPLDSPHSKSFQNQSPGLQHQNYSRFDGQDIKIDMNNLSAFSHPYENTPHSARSLGREMNFSAIPTSTYLSKMPELSIRGTPERDVYQAPHSASPYSSNIFDFPTRFSDSNSSTGSSSYRENSLQDLNEIAADPAKFMQWIGSSK